MSTSTLHNFPILFVQVVIGLMAVLIGWKISAIISNPNLFLQPTVDAAAQDIAMICDGKLDYKTLPPPPPGASYLIMNCQERLAAKTTSGVYMTIQLVKMTGALREMGKAVKLAGNDLKKSVSGLKSFEKVVKTDGKTLVIAENDVKEGLKTVKETREVLKRSGEIEKKISSSAKGLSSGIDDNAKALRTNIKKADDELGDVEKALENSKGTLKVDCAKDKELCDTLKPSNLWSEKISGVGGSLTSLMKSVDVVSETARNAGKVSKAIRKAAKGGWSLMKKTTAVAKDAGVVIAVGIRHPAKGLNTLAKLRALAWGYRNFALPFARIMFSRRQTNIAADYLDRNDGFYDILVGSFVGVKYTPYMVNLVNDTSQEVIDFYRESINVSNEFQRFGDALKDNSSNFLGTKGYYLTSTYITESETGELLKLGQNTNIDPSIFTYLTLEYYEKLDGKCETEACNTYRGLLLNDSFSLMYGNMDLNRFKTRAGSYSDSQITNDQSRFLDVIDYLEDIDKRAQKVVDDSETLQKKVASWMKTNCETETIQYDNSPPLEVASCGMVIDCTPGDFCYVGLPVISSNPWISYLPISLVEKENVPTIARISGLNYDSSSRVVKAGGLFGCGGELIDIGIGTPSPPEKKAFICASLPEYHRCKVVNCGKYVDTQPDNFNPDVIIKGNESKITIGGNFLTW